MKKLFLLLVCALVLATTACAPQEEAIMEPVVLYNLVEQEFDVELADFKVVLEYAAQNGYQVAHIRRNPLVNTLTATFKVPVV